MDVQCRSRLEGENDGLSGHEVKAWAMDGDYLVGAGRGFGNDGDDVGLSDAGPAEVAYWAADAALAHLAERLDDETLREAARDAVQMAYFTGGASAEDIDMLYADAALATVRAALLGSDDE